ncbi:hypothetical protein BC941DRAFT_474164 [Chlamydoabsidia padenii]|nr:hypothetical protein BC941DRAFT_474164 [Chlamydoabsidia padenii]
MNTCETVAPTKRETGDQSDFSKIGMRGMVNKMLDVTKVKDARIYGILVEAYHVITFDLDMSVCLYCVG